MLIFGTEAASFQSLIPLKFTSNVKLNLEKFAFYDKVKGFYVNKGNENYINMSSKYSLHETL